MKNINNITVLAFDAGFTSKAGEKTPGVGYFCSGVAGSGKMGFGVLRNSSFGFD
ncbi:MAG: hypothetical protein JSS94_00345 [Bacteroidetes bacterium]|nr:hypothetical protein [Bacteroidota bacterium]